MKKSIEPLFIINNSSRLLNILINLNSLIEKYIIKIDPTNFFEITIDNFIYWLNVSKYSIERKNNFYSYIESILMINLTRYISDDSILFRTSLNIRKFGINIMMNLNAQSCKRDPYIIFVLSYCLGRFAKYNNLELEYFNSNMLIIPNISTYFIPYYYNIFYNIGYENKYNFNIYMYTKILDICKWKILKRRNSELYNRTIYSKIDKFLTSNINIRNIVYSFI